MTLHGMTILYIGGVHRLGARLNDVVAALNGRLLLHDGGVEDGEGRLLNALQRADAIVCPLGCVSHNAVGHIKKACRQSGKPFIALRSKGLSRFRKELQALRTPQLVN